MSDQEIGAALGKILAARGPLTEDELLLALEADGLDLGHDPTATLSDVIDRYAGMAMYLTDQRMVWLPALLEGRIFTHRLSATEVEGNLLTIEPDFLPAAMLTEQADYRWLSDGSSISETDDLDALLLPAGALTELGSSAGDLVGLRIAAQSLDLVAVSEADSSTAIADALAATLGDHPEELDTAVFTACARHDALFREAALPLSELIEASGLACEARARIAPPGFDFDAWRLHSRASSLEEAHDLNAAEAVAVVLLLQMYEGRTDDDSDTVRTVLDFLVEPDVATAFLREARSGYRGVDAESLRVFADTMRPLASRAARPVLRWLQGRAYEMLGDVVRAEASFRDGESLNSSWPLTLIALARYAYYRGDAERALSLLRRADADPGHRSVRMLERFLPPSRPDLGRNQPCWCGSGRKYKVCHLNREQLSLDDRAGWLYEKAAYDLMDGPFAPTLVDLAYHRASYWSEDEIAERLDSDRLPTDLVLFEGGAFAEFLTLWGSLLPDDERLLAEQWLLTERSVFDVIAVRPGEGLTVRDVRTGDMHEVVDAGATPGALYCGRVLPAGDTMQALGGMEPVSLGERDDLIALLDSEPGPVELVEFLSRRFAAPVLQNSDGDPLALCEATLRASDLDALVSALDDEYGRHADQSPTWHELDESDHMRAEIILRGETLHVHTISENRLDSALATISELDPSVTVLTRTSKPFPDARQWFGRQGPALDADPDPEILAVLDDMVRKREVGWLDEALPALGGRTPRECAADPTRRPDVIRVLDSFPDDGGRPGAMSRARLRAALGLS